MSLITSFKLKQKIFLIHSKRRPYLKAKNAKKQNKKSPSCTGTPSITPSPQNKSLTKRKCKLKTYHEHCHQRKKNMNKSATKTCF